MLLLLYYVYEGIYLDTSTAHFYGEATAIHSNGDDGIFAASSGKVIIYLPSHHNTSYNNGKQDRITRVHAAW